MACCMAKRWFNIHGLVHLACDVKVHGPLDGISGFPYENYLAELKRLVRKPHNPLQSMFQEYREKEALYTYPLDSRNMGVFIVSNLSTVMHFTELTKPWQKCVRRQICSRSSDSHIFIILPINVHRS